MSCRKAAAGFSNCCKGGGWGSDVGRLTVTVRKKRSVRLKKNF
nr:conjugal transfer protein TraN [Klebsiella pneumoniae]